jgi:hypothetical protein
LRWLFARLDTSVAQEKVIVEAAETLRERARQARRDWQGAREEVASAIRGGAVSPDALRDVLGRHEGALKELKDVGLAQLQRVIEVLDERQRATLADLLERFGYRGAAWGH